MSNHPESKVTSDDESKQTPDDLDNPYHLDDHRASHEKQPTIDVSDFAQPRVIGLAVNVKRSNFRQNDSQIDTER
jgi:hypothetical protein